MVTEKPQANKPLFITKEFEFVLLLYYALKYATIIDHTRSLTLRKEWRKQYFYKVKVIYKH